MTEFASADTIRPATTTAAGNERKRGIDRVIILLEALLRQRAPMRVGDIARKIGAPRSTTYEIVNRLLEADMLETVGNDGHVYFGRAMHLFGWAYSHHNAHYPRIIEALERLAAESGETVQLCGLRGNKYVVLDSRASVGPFRISSQVGVEVPIPWTASGRLLLSHMDDDAVRAFIPAEDFRLPDGRVIAEAEFLGDIALAKQQGYSETAALADRFTWCLAAPILDGRGQVSLTLCFVLPVDTPEARRVALLAQLRESAAGLDLTGD